MTTMPSSISVLNMFDALRYQHMTFPFYRKMFHWLEDGKMSPVVAVGAEHAGKPQGLIVALIDEKGESSEVLSIYTAPEYRRQGVATVLFSRLEQTLLERGVKKVKVSFERGRPNRDILESILRKLRYKEPRFGGLMCRIFDAGNKMKQAPWLEKSVLPAAFEIFSWKDLTAQERDSILEKPWFPDNLSPFGHLYEIDALTSIGLRCKGEVVGWMVNHRISPDTIRYTSLFVRDDLQPYGLSIPLLAESIRLYVYSEEAEKMPKVVFKVPARSQAMMHFVRKNMAAYVDEVNELVRSSKDLRKDG